MAIVAFELDENQILVAAARAARPVNEIQQVFSIPIDGLSDVEAAEKFKSVLAKYGLSRSDTIIVVSRTSVEMREVVVPPAPDAELPDMVRFLARNEFASLNDNWLLDYIPLSKDASVPRNVLAAGMSPEFHRQITSLADAAGLKVKHIVVRPLATVGLLRSKFNDVTCRLIVNPNGDQTDMTIVVGPEPVATRSVRIPASFDAEQRAQSLVGELKRTLASFRQSLGDQQVGQIIFVGSVENNGSLQSLLQEQLKIGVDFVDPIGLANVTSKLSLPPDTARFASLLGCLRQQDSGSRHPIDFLNPRRPVIKKIDRSRLYLFGGLALAATLLAVMFCWWTLHSQASEIAGLQKELADASRLNNGGDDGKRPKVAQIMGEVSKIDQWKTSDIDWLEEIYQYSEKFLTPDDAIVDSFDAGVRRDEPQIIVKSRVAGVQKESVLIDSLDSRPYQIVPTKSGVSAEDPSYPMSFDFNLMLSADRSGVIDRIDEKTTEFLKQRFSHNETDSEPNVQPANKAEAEKDSE